MFEKGKIVAAFPNPVCHFGPQLSTGAVCRSNRGRFPGGRPRPRPWPPGENNEPFSCKDVWIVPWRWEKHKLEKHVGKKWPPTVWVELIIGMSEMVALSKKFLSMFISKCGKGEQDFDEYVLKKIGCDHYLANNDSPLFTLIYGLATIGVLLPCCWALG